MTHTPVLRFAVVGNPVAHSRSPFIHAAFAGQTGIALQYDTLLAPHDGFETCVQRFFNDGGCGLNVTVPFKEQAWALASAQLSPRARLARAVNTLWQAQGALAGCNTDGAGLIMDLERLGHAPAGKRVLLLGAGGAARGALPALLDAGCAALHVANRNPARAEGLCTEMADHAGATPLSAGALDAIAGDWDLVVNATASSLAGQPPLQVQLHYAPGALAYDMVYAAQDTPFLRTAAEQGASARADGLGMLVAQAAVSFEIWHGVRPDPAPVLAALRRQMTA